jgi:tetratricopeptide (TPR) repeat protein
MIRRATAVAVAALALAAPTAAQEPTRVLLEEAIASYTRGLNTEERDQRLEEFRRAERLFARVVESGVHNADLYTNMGNAALQAERMGSAVLAYRRALLLDPGRSRALQNLDHARALLPEWVPRPEAGGLLDTFFFWHHTLPRAERALAAASCFAAMALLLAAAIRFRQTALRHAALLPGLLWVALFASVLLDPAAQASSEAVVTADEVVARAADSALAPMTFPQPLPGGVEVRILERRSPWLRVRLANGRDAWVRESSVTPVAPF